MPTARTNALVDESREQTNALLRSHLRATSWIILAALPALVIRDLLVAPDLSVAVYVVRAGCAFLAICALAALHVRRLARHPVALALIVGLAVCVDVTAVGSLRQDLETAPLLLSAVAMFGAAVFRCGLGPQIALVAMAEVGVLYSAYAVTGSLAGAVNYHHIVAVITFAMSIYVANQLERQRRAIEHGALALGRSEAHFRSLTENSSDLVTILDRVGIILYDSPAQERLLGYTPEERIGTDGVALIHPDDRAAVLGTMALSVPGQPTKLEYRYRHKNGSWRHIEAVVQNLLDDPNVGGLVVNSRDISQRHQMEERHLRQRDALTTLTERTDLNSGDLGAALRQITEISARTLGVARTSIWRYNRARTVLQCVDLYELEADRHSSGATLSAIDYPTYFRSLEALEVMAVDDAPHDPRTREFESGYLQPSGISSMLDAPIRFGGMVDGVLCHEQVGPPRTWTADEKTFAAAIVNLVSLALEGWERKKAENAQSLLTAILDATPDVVSMADARNAHILYMNPAGRKVLGIGTGEDLTPLTITDAHPDWANTLLHDQIIPTAIRDGVWTGESAFLSQDGREIPVLTVFLAHKSPSGEVERFSSVSRDITERKRAEAQLLDAKQAAEAANRAKSEFLANMSHEIRTPMNGIIGMTDLALQTELTAEQRECLEMVAASSDALLTVINDVLDFSKIEAGKLDLDPVAVEVRDVLADTLRPMAMRAQLKGLNLAYEVHPNVPEVVVLDPHRLRQVLTNLVGNATKFTEQGEVLVAVTSAPQSAAQAALHFSVRDTGVGIAPEKQQLIFQAFTQADSSTTRQYGGSGLGLTISRKLVELMGGRIWVESEVGCGSTFHFTVPCERAAPAPKASPATRASLEGLPVLVVDDNPTNRRILQEMLTAWRMCPTTVDSGHNALRCLMDAVAAGRPLPLVLIDAHMPEMSGIELAARIKQTPELAATTMLMLSSADLTGEAARCRELGMAAFLTKPVRQSEMLDTILIALAPMSTAAEPVGAPGKPRPAAPGPAVHRSRHVLLAEDNVVNQRLAVRLLEKHGHTIVVANNGREAVAAAAREAFDVVFMDVQMPELDGFEATAAIRAAERETGAHVPIVAMTAHAMSGDEQRCREAGMDDYLTMSTLASAASGNPKRTPSRKRSPSQASGGWLRRIRVRCAGETWRPASRRRSNAFLGASAWFAARWKARALAARITSSNRRPF